MRMLAVGLIFAIASTPVLAQDGQIKWTHGKADQDFAAVALNSKQDTMVYFTARWEPECKKLNDRVFAHDEVVRLSEKWQCVIVDVSELGTYNQAQTRQKLSGLPTVRFFSKEGKQVDEILLLADVGSYIAKLKGEGRLWKNEQPRIDAAGWMDTHRLYLKNDSPVDGIVKEVTEEIVVMQWDPNSEVRFKRSEVLRIEMITIRQIGKAPVDITAKPCPNCGGAMAKGAAQCEKCSAGRTTPDASPKCAACGKTVEAGRAKCRECETMVRKFSPAVMEKVDAIVKTLKANVNESNADVIDKLIAVGPEALAYSASICDQVDPNAAAWLLAAITRAKEKRAAPFLREKLLTLKEGSVLITCMNTLVVLDDSRSVPMIQKLATHPEPVIRAAAVEALGQIGTPHAMRELTSAIVDIDRSVRLKATTALTTWGRRLQIQNSVYMNLRNVVANAPEARREQVPFVLSKLGLKEAAPFIIQFLRSTVTDVRANAVVALGELEYREAAEPFYAMLETEKETRIKVSICGALTRIKDGSGVEKLIAVMEREGDTDLRLAAARTLQALTKQRYGPDPSEWRKWWNAQRGVRPEDR